MKKTLLFGEPMALLIADEPGPLEKCEHFTRSMSGAEVYKTWAQGGISDQIGR